MDEFYFVPGTFTGFMYLEKSLALCTQAARQRHVFFKSLLVRSKNTSQIKSSTGWKMRERSRGLANRFWIEKRVGWDMCRIRQSTGERYDV